MLIRRIIVWLLLLCVPAAAANIVTGPSGAGFTALGAGATRGTNLPNRNVAGASYKIVCLGDSITRNDVGSVTEGYCGRLASAVGTARSITVTFKPMGLAGYSWNYSYPFGPPDLLQATINSASPSQIDTELASPNATNVLIMFAGTNGLWATLGGHSAATEYSDFQMNFNARMAAGWSASRTVVVTTLPRANDSTFNTTRAAYNAALKSFCTANGCIIADAGGDATIGCDTCATNPNCFQADEIHLNDNATCGGVSGGGMGYLATQILQPLMP